MAHTTYHVELKISNPKSGYGILRIRKTKDRIKSYVSLKEKVIIDDWNFDTNKPKLKKGNSVYVDRIENLILSTIARLKQEDQNTSEVKVITDKKKHSFMAFFTKSIAHLEKTKYSTFLQKRKIYNSLMDFLETKGKTDLLIEELNVDFVVEYERFLTLTLKEISYKKYVSDFRTIYNQLKDSDEYDDLVMKDPFRKFDKKTTNEPEEKSLSVEQFNSLVNHIIPRHSPIYYTRLYFIFCVYAGGLRVSDLMTLRWNTFSSDGFNFLQFKTRSKHYVYISFLISEILLDFMPEYKNKIEALKKKKYYYDEGKNTIIHFDDTEDIVIFYTQQLAIKHSDKNGSFDKEKVITDLKLFKGWLEEAENDNKVDVKDNITNDGLYKIDLNDSSNVNDEAAPIHHKSKAQQAIEDEMLEDRLDLINQYAKEYSENFIFPFLDKNDFKKIDFNRTEKNLGKELTNKISYAETKHNRNLKTLQKEVFGDELGFPLSSHVARHTLTTILIQREESIYTIQKILGHNSIKITEGYISRFQHLNLIRKASIT